MGTDANSEVDVDVYTIVTANDGCGWEWKCMCQCEFKHKCKQTCKYEGQKMHLLMQMYMQTQSYLYNKDTNAIKRANTRADVHVNIQHKSKTMDG
jgi:hypothetical protein